MTTQATPYVNIDCDGEDAGTYVKIYAQDSMNLAFNISNTSEYGLRRSTIYCPQGNNTLCQIYDYGSQSVTHADIYADETEIVRIIGYGDQMLTRAEIFVRNSKRVYISCQNSLQSCGYMTIYMVCGYVFPVSY